MKLFFPLLTLIILSLNSSGQHLPLWVSYYSGGSDLYYYPSDMVLDNSGNIFVTTSVNDTARTTALLIKFSPSGSILWDFHDTDLNFNTHLAITKSENIYLVGEALGDIRTQLLDQNGSILWIDNFDNGCNGLDDPFSICTDENSNIYITGQSGGCTPPNVYDEIVSLKYDSIGNLKWANFSHGTHNLARGLAIGADSFENVYITGFNADTPITESNFIIKYDSQGNTQWSHKIPNAGIGESDLLSIFHDSLIILGGNRIDTTGFYRPYSAAYDSSGNLRWFTPFDTNSYHSSKSMIVDESGNSYFTGYYMCRVIKTDNSGNFVWNKLYNPLLGGNVYTFITQDNHGYFYLGMNLSDSLFHSKLFIYQFDSSGIVTDSFSYTFPDGYGGDIRSLKYDPLGALIASGNAAIAGNGGIFAIKFELTTNLNSVIRENSSLYFSPNPFRSSTTLSLIANLNAKYHQLQIFDYTGRLIRTEPFESTPYSLNRCDLTSGIYIVRLTDSNGIIRTGKLVCE